MRTLMLLGLCGLFSLAGLLIAGDDKKDTSRGKLPKGWKKLDLSDNQSKDIRAIDADYTPKIEDLEGQLKQVKEQRYDKMIKVLSEEQRKRLKELNQSSGGASSAGSSSGK